MRPHELNQCIASKSSKMQITAPIWRARLIVANNLMRARIADATRSFMMYWLSNRGVPLLESEPRGQLKLTPGSDGGKYSGDVVGEVTSCIFEDRVAVPSQSKGALRITRNTEIRMVEKVIGFHSNRNLPSFSDRKIFVQRCVKLRGRGPPQDISSGIAELTGRRYPKTTWIEPA